MAERPIYKWRLHYEWRIWSPKNIGCSAYCKSSYLTLYHLRCGQDQVIPIWPILQLFKDPLLPNYANDLTLIYMTNPRGCTMRNITWSDAARFDPTYLLWSSLFLAGSSVNRVWHGHSRHAKLTGTWGLSRPSPNWAWLTTTHLWARSSSSHMWPDW